MSTGDRISLARATQKAQDFLSLIQDVTKAEICGSIRRKRPQVGDIEIVALPEDRRVLLARLDRLVADGTFSKAQYGDNLAHRWGDTYRGLMFESMKVEVFCATPENIGFIRWLRTGPGDANTHVMTRMGQTNWPVRFRQGYAWHDEGGQSRKLDASTEELIFSYLGLNFIKPEDRALPAYGRVCQSRLDVYYLREQYLEEPDTPHQTSMF
jgi:DNA polymerase/3'-5' exonuclease PolX